MNTDKHSDSQHSNHPPLGGTEGGCATFSRRDFIKVLGSGAAVATTATLTGCNKSSSDVDIKDNYDNQQEPPKGKMTYRTTPTTKDRVSLLGYGMMRLPMMEKKDKNDGTPDTIDQEQVNHLVDYAMEHGVNYYDTSPVYCQGFSERATGIALSRYPRNSYYIATKLSNFSEAAQSFEGAKKMYLNSMKELQTDYIDYYLLHAVGGGGLASLNQRYIDNGVLDFLLEERKAGRIRNLGWSFHGEIEVFDWLLANNDKYHWDFVQIQMNYVDWNPNCPPEQRNVSGAYLYGELEKLGIPAVIMEPLLGGRLANLPKYVVKTLKERDPQRSVASWAFRYAGTQPNILTVLSGMTYMEHLIDNLQSFCPLTPLTDDEIKFLYKVAEDIRNVATIPCNDCKYCMPCPYGIDIPALFVHYNKCLNAGTLPSNPSDSEYARLRKQYLIGLARQVPRERQPDHCIGCGQCVSHCPQNIRIPREMRRLDEFIENLKKEG